MNVERQSVIQANLLCCYVTAHYLYSPKHTCSIVPIIMDQNLGFSIKLFVAFPWVETSTGLGGFMICMFII